LIHPDIAHRAQSKRVMACFVSSSLRSGVIGFSTSHFLDAWAEEEPRPNKKTRWGLPGAMSHTATGAVNNPAVGGVKVTVSGGRHCRLTTSQSRVRVPFRRRIIAGTASGQASPAPFARMLAVNCELFTKVVDRALPFQFTTQLETKRVPLRVNSNPALPGGMASVG
jgi:hypothetical protein